MACILDILEDKDNVEYLRFFESFASLWRIKYTAEYFSNLIITDSHAPNKFRVNCVLQQFSKFYDTYSINEKDNMYLNHECRLLIW